MISTLLSLSSTFKYIGYIFIAILVLLFMVLIHELGHYIAGKILKFKINEFSVGFGPKLFQKKNKSGELISLRAFPLGGYCAFEGETDENKDNPQAFNNQKTWKRLIVLFCGAFFNFLSGIIFSFVLLMASGYDLVQVDNINYNTSINRYCLQTGDVIYGIENNKIDFVNDEYFATLISDHLVSNFKKYEGDITVELNTFTEDGETYYMVQTPLTFNIKRNGEKKAVEGYVNTIYNDKGDYCGWTLLSSNEETDEFGLKTYKYSFFEALGEAIPFTCKWSWKVLVIFGQLITGQLSVTALGGPVTTVKMIANFTQQNMLLLLLPLIAVNLAVFNLLPIPALDGFQMVFVIIEWIRKKPIKREVVNMINNIGLIVLLGFVIVVDILQFVL